jgi:hypothetical protein
MPLFSFFSFFFSFFSFLFSLPLFYYFISVSLSYILFVVSMVRGWLRLLSWPATKGPPRTPRRSALSCSALRQTCAAATRFSRRRLAICSCLPGRRRWLGREGHPRPCARALPREPIEAAFFSFVLRSRPVRARFLLLHARSGQSWSRLAVQALPVEKLPQTSPKPNMSWHAVPTRHWDVASKAPFGRASPPASGAVWSHFLSNGVKWNGSTSEAP